MAYISEIKSTYDISTTNPLNLKMPAHVAGDLLLAVGHGRYSAATLSAVGGGLTNIGNQTNCGAWWKIAASSSEAFSSNYASAQAWQVICIKDAHATTPIKGSAYNSITGSAYTLNTPVIDTTGDNDCLIIHAYNVDSGNGYRNPFLPRAYVAAAYGYSSVLTMSEVRHGAGNTTARALWGSTNAGGSWHKIYSIAIKNKASAPVIDLTIKSTPEMVTQWGGALGAPGLTVQAPNAVSTMTTLDGIKPYTAGSTNGVSAPSGWANSIQLSDSAIPTVAGGYTGGAWMGTIWSFTSTIDFAGKTLMFPIRYVPNWDSRTGADGVALLLVDSTDNWVAFQLHAQVDIVENIDFHFLLSCDTLTPWKSYGTMNWGAVKRMGFLHHRSPDTSGYANYIHTYAPLLLTSGSPCVMVGHFAGAVTVARLYGSLYAAAGGIGHTFKQGRGQLVVRVPLQLGDGSTKTVVAFAGQSIEFPAVDAAYHRIANNTINLTLYASSADTMDFAASIIATEIRQTFTIHASSSLSAAYAFSGASIIGWDVVWKTGVPCALATFSECYTIDGKAQKFDTDTFTGCLLASGAYLRLDGGADTDNKSGAVGSTFTKGGETYAVELRTAGYYDFTDTTFSGYTNELYISGPAGTYTITLAVGQTQPDVYNPNSRTIVWDVPTVDVTFGPLIAGSQVIVFADGTTTELFSNANSATSEVWAGASGAYDYTIMKAGYLPVRGSGASPTASITIDPQQKVDRAYVASSGLTMTGGSPNCSANTGTLKFGLTADSTLQNFYSYMIEQWISNTALRNQAFPIVPNGPSSFRFIDWTWDADASIDHLSRDGMQYYNSATSTATDIWAAILSVGVPAGMQVRYQQQDGLGTTNAQNTGNIDQLIKIKKTGAGAFDCTNWLVLKVQQEGYDQAEAVAVDIYGTLEDQLYVVGLTPLANGIAAQAGITGVTIYSEPTPVSWNGQLFSTTITDTTDTHSGLQIMQYVRSLDNFNLHDMIRANGAKFKTVTGNVYGDTLTTPAGVRVVKADGTTPHPDFDLFIADSGGSYVPDVVAPITWAGALNGTTVLLYNDSNAGALIDTQAVSGAGGYDWTISLPHADVAVGDSLRLRYGNKAYYAGELQGTMTSSGLAFVGSMTLHPIYAAWGLNGSTYDQASGGPFTMDGVNLEIDIGGGAGTGLKKALGAWTQHLMTLPAGLDAFYGAWDLLDLNQIRQNVAIVDVLIDKPTAGQYVFTDNDVNYYRSDFSIPYNTTHSTIFMTYNAKPFVAMVASAYAITGTAAEIIAAIDAVPTGAENASAVRSELGTELAAVLQTLKFARNKRTLDPTTGQQTVYDDDGSTELGTGAVYLDVAGTQPYDGTGAVHRTEQLA